MTIGDPGFVVARLAAIEVDCALCVNRRVGLPVIGVQRCRLSEQTPIFTHRWRYRAVTKSSRALLGFGQHAAC